MVMVKLAFISFQGSTCTQLASLVYQSLRAHTYVLETRKLRIHGGIARCPFPLVPQTSTTIAFTSESIYILKTTPPTVHTIEILVLKNQVKNTRHFISCHVSSPRESGVSSSESNSDTGMSFCGFRTHRQEFCSYGRPHASVKMARVKVLSLLCHWQIIFFAPVTLPKSYILQNPIYIPSRPRS